MKIIAVTLNKELPKDITLCDIVVLFGNIIPSNYSKAEQEYWINSKFSKWINDLPTKTVLTLSKDNLLIQSMDRLNKSTKYKLEILDNQLMTFSTDDNVYRIYGHTSGSNTPFCDILITEQEKLLKKFLKDKKYLVITPSKTEYSI